MARMIEQEVNHFIGHINGLPAEGTFTTTRTVYPDPNELAIEAREEVIDKMMGFAKEHPVMTAALVLGGLALLAGNQKKEHSVKLLGDSTKKRKIPG